VIRIAGPVLRRKRGAKLLILRTLSAECLQTSLAKNIIKRLSFD
jgi:hypothetical protein